MKPCFFGLLLLLSLSLVIRPTRAEEIRGYTGIIKFEPPSGYCEDPSRSSDKSWVTRVESASPHLRNLHIWAVFTPCLGESNPPIMGPLFLEEAGFGYLGQIGLPGVPSFDRFRAKTVASLAAFTKGDPTALMKYEGDNDSGLYLQGQEKGRPSQVAEELITVIQDTLIVIHLQLATYSTDDDELEVIHKHLRQSLDETLKALGTNNGFTPNEKISAEAASDAEDLQRLTAFFCFGGVSLVAISVRRLLHKILLVALVALGGGMLYQSVPVIDFYTSYLALDYVVYALVLFGLLSVVNALLSILANIAIGSTTITERLRYAISSNLWSVPAIDNIASKDFAKRWFVTVSAATGSVTFSLLASDSIYRFFEAFDRIHIVLTILIAIVSITLVGPIEEYVFESAIASSDPPTIGEAHGHGPEQSRFEQILQLASPRAFFRFLSVLLFCLAVTGLFGTIEDTLRSPDTSATLLVVLGSVTPAVATYFWCAALQRRVDSVAWRAGLASLVGGILLYGLPVALFTVFFLEVPLFCALSHAGTFDLLNFVGALLLLLILAPTIIGWGMLAVFSQVGGLVIDLARQRRFSSTGVVALLAVVLALTSAVIQLCGFGLLSIYYHTAPVTGLNEIVLSLVSPLGWAFGLFISGFPSVLRASGSFAPQSRSSTEPGQPAKRPSDDSARVS